MRVLVKACSQSQRKSELDLVIPKWEDDASWQVPLHMLKPWAPIGYRGTYPWNSWVQDTPFRYAEVREAIKNRKFQRKPMALSGLLRVSARSWHLRRIAFLAESIVSWINDPKEGIEIDFGVPSLGWTCLGWPICDGNHRLAACFYQRVKYVPVVCCGDWEFAAKCFRQGYVG